MVRCADGSLYTGCSNDVEKRVSAHNAGRGARYTRSRLPVKLVWSKKIGERGAAMSREAFLKQLTRAEKLALIRSARELRKSQLRRQQAAPRRAA